MEGSPREGRCLCPQVDERVTTEIRTGGRAAGVWIGVPELGPVTKVTSFLAFAVCSNLYWEGGGPGMGRGSCLQ